jgi:prevent-host-death family protein
MKEKRLRNDWQLQEAKNKLSEVVDKAQSVGPQEITRHGKKAAVILSFQAYQNLRKKKGSLVEFFRRSPLAGLDLKRSKDLPREVKL